MRAGHSSHMGGSLFTCGRVITEKFLGYKIVLRLEMDIGEKELDAIL